MKTLYSMYMSIYQVSFFQRVPLKHLFLCAFLGMASSLNAQIVIDGEVTTDCACPDDEDAFLDITVSGGVPPYTYAWTLNGSEVICSPRVDFSPLNGIGCPPAGAGQNCAPDQDCSDPSTAINNQNFVVGDAVLTVSPPVANGGACIDENLINDSTLDGFFSIRTGVSQLGNQGPAANVTRTWTFGNPVCDLQILLNDIDGEDAIIVMGKLNGVTIPLTADDFIITNTTPAPACPVFVGGNTWQSQNGCSSADNTDRGGILITFPSCLDEIEFIYYDYTGGAGAGGSYAVGFSSICAADLQCIQGGLYQVEVTDATGAVSTAEFDVPDVDIPSDIVCPDDITAAIAAGDCDAVVNWTPPLLEDGCPAAILICTHDSGDTFPVGTTTVTCNATDDAGNSSDCSFNVTVTYDNTLPTLVCPTDIAVNADAGSCTATSVTWVPPTLSNDCELTTLSGNFQPGDDFPTGTTTVTYVGSDSGGNTYECSFDITVTNTGLPLILNCPTDVTITAGAGQCDATATWTPPTPDPNCNVVITSSSHDPGDIFPIGTTTVSYVVTDSNGNTNTCSFDVTVVYDSNPTLVCPVDISLNADAGSCTATSVNWTPPTLSNDCELINLVSNFQPGDDFPTGTTTVDYLGTDSAGNIFECSFEVTVTNTGLPLILNCPDDIDVVAAAGACDATATWTPPIPDPTCDATITSSTNNPGDVFPIGTTTVSYIVTDSNGNTNTCSFEVTITYDSNPTLDCPADITVNAEVGDCVSSVSWTPPTLSNDCDIATLTSNFNPGDNFPAGTTTVTYTATDAGGNTFECSFDITVINDAQTIVLECPDDISLVVAAGQCDAVATWTPPVPDENCGATITGSNYNPGDVFPIGTTTVIYTATDISGNNFECSFDVTVDYDFIPTLVCPVNITLDADAGSCTATSVNWTPPTLSNDCALTTLTSNFEPGDDFPTGTTTVNYTGTDSGGNTFTCSFDITVINTGLPLILNCPGDIDVVAAAGECDATATWTPPTPDPNCDIITISSSHNPGATFPIGTTTVTYTVTDGSGSTNTCSFEVSVTYDSNPTLVCPADIAVNADAGSCTATSVTWDEPTLSNDCNLTTLTSNFNSGDDFPTGTTTVTYTGTDSGGNTFTCSFDVTVTNTGLPLILNCPNDIDITASAGQCDATLSWTPPTPDPNCDIVTITSSHDPGATFPIGTTTVTYTVTDGSGSTNTCSFDITVDYDSNPTLVCPANIAVDADAGSCTATAVTWNEPTLSNDCNLTTLTSNFNSGDDFPTGTTTVTYTGTDSGGNTFTCSFDVTVTNTGLPLILNCPNNINIAAAAGQCDANVSWAPPIPDPTCDIVTITSSHNPGEAFLIGTTTVTYTVTDASGTTNTCSFDITVTYVSTPTLVCPADIAVDADAGSCTATSVTWTPPTLSNDCDLAALTSNFEPGDDFPTGTTTVTYIGTDSGGNTFECSFDVTVTNTGLPLILNCPDDIDVVADPGACDATATWTPPIPDPNCDIVTITSSHDPGATFLPGITTVTYTVTDGSGSTNTCSFDVRVTYNSTPTLVCPTDITVNAEVGDCVSSVSWTPPTLSNDCDIATLISNFEPGDNFPAGTTTVTYTAIDPGGNIFECSFDITVINDAQTTVLQCPDDISLVAAAGACDAVATWAPPVPDENCGAIITGSTHEPGDVFPIGTTTVIYTAVDVSGNNFECSFDITVTYDSNPTLVCPADIAVDADAGSCTATSVNWTPPTLSNDCALTTLTSDFEPGDDFPTGTTIVTYTGTDSGGNTFECSFNVTVTNTGVPLILNCPNNIEITATAGACDAAVSWTPPTPDPNCDIVTITSSHDPGATFSIGTTTVTYTVTDGSGGTNTCSFDITVTYDSNPTLVCPADISVDADAGSCTATSVTWTPPTLSNDCSLTTLTSDFEPGDDFPTGTTTVTYTGSDAGGNVFECSFDVIVTNTGAPIILNCPNDIDLVAGIGQCDAVATWTPPTPDPTCDAVITSSSHEPGDEFPLGTTTVTYVVTDGSGNTNTCNFNVTVTYNSNPVLVCPFDITVNAVSGTCNTTVAWILPSLSNSCNLSTLESNYAPGDEFPVGTTTVTYTATDEAGNVFECSFNVTVVNTGVPLILNCPDDISLNLAPGVCDAVVTWTPPVPDPNCDAVITSSSHEPGDTFFPGITTVTYIITDGSGNTNTCSFDVTVNYNSEPTLVCPTDVTVNAEVGSCVSPVTWTPPTLSNNCTIATLDSNFSPGDNFPAGTTVVTYTATDPGGNTFECSFSVTVINDDETTVLDCPNDVSLPAAPGQCEAIVTWDPPVPDVNCNVTITGSTHEPGDAFPIGTTIVTYTATDPTGNIFECSFDITVTYSSTPTLVCPADIAVDADAGSCTATAVTWTPPTLSNDCDLTTLDSNFQPGDDFPTGTTTVTYTGGDAAGNVFECSFNVIVTNNGPPIIVNCPDDISVSTNIGECDAIAAWTPPTPDENCDALITSSSHNPGDVFPIGTTTVTYVATGQNGMTATCSFDVTVTYGQTPTLNCPQSITLNALPGQCTTSITWTPPSLNSNCELVNVTSTHEPGSAFPVGTTTVMYTATDAGGNVFECDFNITVNSNGPPQIENCPNDFTVNTAPGACDAIATWIPPTPDENCDATVTSNSHNPGDTFPIGTTTVTYIITDANGLTSTCSFDITVTYDTNPTLGCPSAVTVNGTPGACTATASWIPPTLSNDCSLTTLNSNYEPGDVFPIGVTTVTYTGNDSGGNVFECSFDVTVVGDDQTDVLICPDDIIMSVVPGQCQVAVTWIPPVPDENCGVTLTGSNYDSGDVFPIGTTTVTYTAEDELGNVFECNFDITVIYSNNPSLVCPENITVDALPGTCSAPVTWAVPIFTSTCGLASLVGSADPGDALPIGTTTVNYVGTDNGGNVFECSFDVTVNSNGLGEILTCPDDISLVAAPGACDAVVTWDPPVVDENCDATITSSTHNPGDVFPAGMTTVTYIATDGSGNETSCSFDINIAYETNPTLICPDDITIDVAAGACTAVATWEAPTLSNDCELDTVLGDYASGDEFPLGTTTVTITATDPGGNVFECSFDVTVISGNRSLVIVCPDDITTTVTPGQCEAVVTWEPPAPDENCGITITGSTHEPGDVFPIGTTTVTYTAEDESGNTFECSFDITVTYIDSPSLICPQDITVNSVEGTCTASVTWAVPIFSSNCGLSTLVGNYEPGDDFPIGVTTVIYVGTDAAGNGYECSFNVTVISNGPPVILNCPDDVTINTAPGQCDAIATWAPPMVDENCDASITSSSHSPGDVFPIGTTTVTYTATNTAGLEIECIFDVIVLYDVEPTLDCPSNITVNADAGECTTVVSWIPPRLSNNCNLTTLTSNYDPGDNFPAGTTTVTYTGTDTGGNAFECSFDVTVINDAQTSVLECPFDITITAGAGQCEAVVIWTPPVPDESCGATITGSTHEPGDVFQIGTTTVIYTAEDESGNVFECSFDITIVYSEFPTLDCPQDITTNADDASCTTAVSWTAPTLSNNCNLSTLVSNYSPGDEFPTGTTTVTYTGEDTGGNIFECSFDVTVINNGPPIILNCPEDISLVADNGLCAAIATWTPPIPDENCNATITSSSHQPGDSFDIGTTTVSYIVTDVSGNTNTCSFDITVVYNQIPTLVCPSDITADAEEGSCTASISWTPPALSNNCNLPSLIGNYNPGDDFPTGTTTVTYVGVDSGGNTFECSFDITVVNNGPPVILNCPDDINLTANINQCEAVATWTPPVPDENCDAVITNSSHEPGDIFPIGTTTVSYVVTDVSGNSNTCSFDIIVDYTGSPSLVCPSNLTVDTDAGACNAIVTWEEPTLSNDCSLTTIDSNFDSGDNFPVGTTTVTYTATDNAGTVFECSFDVTVVDNEIPQIVCPDDISQTVDPGSCTAVVTWVAPVPTDNCAGVSIVSSSHEPGDIFNVGTTTVTYTIIDANGNVSNCGFIIAVTDNEAPPIVCPESITVNSIPGACLTAVTWQEPVRPPSECLADSVILISNFQSGDLFPVGTTTVEYTAVDNAGNIANCSFNVTVIDVESPTIECQDDIMNVFTNEGECNAVVFWSLPTVIDNCDAAIVSSSHNSGDIFPIGTTTVTHVAEDAAGNSVSCSFDVVVTDKEDPVIACPMDITVSTDPGQCGAIVNWEIPSATDNCGATVTSNYQSGDFIPVGSVLVTYTATDEAGNTAECSFTVTVNDNEPPVVTSCPDNIVVFADPGECTAVVTWPVPLSVDNCQSASVGSTHVSGSIFPIGTTLVLYGILDESGNGNVCFFNVTVLDNQAPTMECPADITVFTDPGQCDAIVDFTVPEPFDNCEANITSNTHAPGDAFPVGTTTVTYTAQDPTGAQVSCSFDITVIDKQVPTITCPADITVNNTPGQCFAPVNWATPAVNDNCGVTSIVTTHNPGSLFPVGITTVKYTISDEEGNIAECTFNITVEDNESPVILECPANIVVPADPGVCNAAVTWTPPTVVDNCSSIIVNSTYTPGALFPLGTTTVLYGILDGDGNSTTCIFTVTVVDEEPPTMNCPADITVFTDPDKCDALVEWTPPKPMDNCEANIVSNSHTPGSAFPVGTTTVTYVAEDITGMQIECSFNVTVVDAQVPTITCPDDISATNNPGQCGSIVNWSLPAINDNCGVTDISTSHSPGDFFPVGTTVVTYTVTDEVGNTANCSFNVTVNDIEPPVAVNCPSDITVFADPGDCYTVVNWEPPTVSDNCSALIVGTTHTPGALFPIGTTTVLYGFLDPSGNGAACFFTVTVIDNEPPTMECPADITVSNDAGECSAIVNWTPPTPIDNCEVEITGSSHAPGDEFPIGTTTVTYTAATPDGVEVTCSFDVTVEDKEAPTITCIDDIVLPTIFGACAAVATWDAPTVSDNCSDGEVSITSSVPPGTIFLPGTTVVTYTATDLAGNQTNCSFAVTVEDREMPMVVDCPDDIVVPNDPGACSAVVTWDTPEFTDNCGIADIDSKPSPGSLFEIGTTTVVYEVTDESGNTNTCTFTVTVEDTEDPMIACPTDITVSNDDGECGAIVNWTPPIPIDNCGAEITSNTHNPGDFFSVGTTTVTYTTVNSAGVELVCSFDVTVEDREDPVLACPADIAIAFDDNSCNAIVTWNVGLIDNCEAEITSNTHTSGDAFEYGTTTVTYTAEDEAGNAHICSFDVTVEDNEAPVILDCPEDITIAGPPGECEGPVLVPTPQFGSEFTDCQETTTISNDYNGTANASDIYPVGTTVVTWTVTDPAGNSVTCQQTIIVNPTDFTDDVVLFTDKDVFVGALFDNADFGDSDSIIIVDPGVPANAVVNTVILDFFFRPEGNSCERDVELEVTDPAGTVFPIFAAPTSTCTGNDAGFQFLLPVASVPTQASGGGVWKLRFRDIEEHNPISAGSPNNGSVPAGTEFSVRFGRITYDITITPDCEGGEIENDPPPANGLPVELAYFKGTEEDCEAILSWGTASEINVSHFEIQRSYDGISFSTIDRVDALGGEGIAADYTYTDAQLTLTNYYRLEIVDNDGQVEYSDIFTIQADCASGVSISDVFPNPSMNQIINVQFNSNMDHEDAKVVVRDMLGRTLMEVPITVFLGSNLITVDPQRLPAASYFLVIEGAGWQSSSAKFVKLN